MRRLVAALLIAGIAFLAVRSPAETTTFDPHDEAECQAYDYTLVYLNLGVCKHYAKNNDVLRVGVKFAGLTSVQRSQMLGLMAEFSTPHFQLTYAGEAAPADCDYQLDTKAYLRVYTPGYLYVCGGEFLRAAGISDPRYSWRSTLSAPWYWYDGRYFTPSEDKRLNCHEFAHQLGLNHGAGNGCESTNYVNGVSSPSAQALAYLDALYQHSDGVQYLIQQSGSAPTPTTSPAPTGTPTASSTPTAAPTPTATPVLTPVKCPAGWRKQGRC
jgi:hypothetical protein